MIKKLFFRLCLISLLLSAWMGIGHALTLGYNFFGTFDSGIYSGQPFSGYFQYDTAENADLQNDFFNVTGISLDLQLPLESFIDSIFDFSIISGGNSSGKLDNLGGHALVPEPATMLLLGVGLVVLGGFGRKRFKE